MKTKTYIPAQPGQMAVIVVKRGYEVSDIELWRFPIVAWCIEPFETDSEGESVRAVIPCAIAKSLEGGLYWIEGSDGTYYNDGDWHPDKASFIRSLVRKRVA